MQCRLIFLLALMVSPTSTVTAVELPSFFSDQMVLQRDANVPIWGSALPGETISLTLGEHTTASTADDQGRWRAEFSPLPASNQPTTLTVQGNKSKQKLVLRNVLIGDVWIGSGQSNMAGRVASYAKNDTTLAKLLDAAPYPNIRLMRGGPKPAWEQADAKTIDSFSALHFAFGECLHRELDVPVGLIVGAVGGTPSGSWIPPKTFAGSQKIKAAVEASRQQYNHEDAMRRYQAKLNAWEKQAAEAKARGEKPRGRQPLPPRQPGESSRGGQIGGLYQRYIQPLAGYRIRGVLWDQGESRSGVVGVEQYLLMTELIRGWRDEWGQGDFPFLFVQKPSGGGSAWSRDNPITRNAESFTAKLPDIKTLGQSGEQRYLYIRLMNDVANAWMVPASDLGSGVHPTNKWGYGNRAAAVALAKVYQQEVPAYGPTYRSHKVLGDQVVIQFDHVGDGLVAAHDAPLQGFALAGEDGRWAWASATIDGDKVTLRANDVPQPRRVRYGYAAKRSWANLFNQAGLPALSFDVGE